MTTNMELLASELSSGLKNEIKDRKGKMVDGSFVKEEDL